jgi:hypothetical protein
LEKLAVLRNKLLESHSTKYVRETTRAALRGSARDYISKGGLFPDAWNDVEPLFHEAAQRQLNRAKNSRRTRHPASLCIERAIEKGVAAGPVELGVHITNPRTNTVRRLVEAAETADRPIRSQEEHHCLQLAPLQRRGWLRAGTTSAWILDWSGLVEGSDRALIFINLARGESYLSLEFLSSLGHRVASQKLALVRKETMRDRVFIRCPIRGTLHDRLYFRDGFFASAQAQRLKTISQLTRPIGSLGTPAS